MVLAPVYITEMSGVAGSGKTTLTRMLSHHEGVYSPDDLQNRVATGTWLGRLAQKPLPSILRKKVPEKIFDNVVASAIDDLRAEKPELFRSVVDAAEAAPNLSPKMRENIVYWTLRSHALYHIAASLLPPGRHFINDEGTVHRAITLFAGGEAWQRNRWRVSRYLRHTPPLNLYIMVDAPNEVCLTRIYRRSSGLPHRLRHSPQSEIEAFLNASRDFAGYLGKLLENQGIPVLYLNTNHDDLDSCLHKINAIFRGFEGFRAAS